MGGGTDHWWAPPCGRCLQGCTIVLQCIPMHTSHLTPPSAGIFGIVPLSLEEWMLVLAFSLPVIAIDEALKVIGRNFVNKRVEAAVATGAAAAEGGRAKVE